jgi:hypothetical protein
MPPRIGGKAGRWGVIRRVWWRRFLQRGGEEIRPLGRERPATAPVCGTCSFRVQIPSPALCFEAPGRRLSPGSGILSLLYGVQPKAAGLRTGASKSRRAVRASRRRELGQGFCRFRHCARVRKDSVMPRDEATLPSGSALGAQCYAAVGLWATRSTLRIPISSRPTSS